MAEPDKKQLARSQEQIQREEEAQKRRIALRREEEERRRREDRRRRIIRNSYPSVFWAAVIGAMFIAIAWNWQAIRAYFLR